MASQYLSRDELADLVDCQPTSRACIRRWFNKRLRPQYRGAAGEG